MPLKHTTETFLIFLLGVAILVTGILIPTLPDLPAGAVPWAFLFILALLYPVALFLLFRSRRADHIFRVLHWYPAAMLLVWLILEIVALEKPRLLLFVDWYSYGWTLPAVALAFIFLIGYCLQVIRRRLPRIILLLAAFIPFTVLAFTSQQSQLLEKQLASVLWDNRVIRSLEGKEFLGFQVAKQLPVNQNLASSEDSSEEAWRVKLRDAEGLRAKALVRRNQRKNSNTAIVAEQDAATAASASGKLIAAVGRTKKLPSAGPEDIAVLGVLLLAAYAAVLQRRAVLRSVSA
ncbi:MAG: hypothetical protein WCG83_07390 [Candidatus Peregrinibacteria bacterium]